MSPGVGWTAGFGDPRLTAALTAILTAVEILCLPPFGRACKATRAAIFSVQPAWQRKAPHAPCKLRLRTPPLPRAGPREAQAFHYLFLNDNTFWTEIPGYMLEAIAVPGAPQLRGGARSLFCASAAFHGGRGPPLTRQRRRPDPPPPPPPRPGGDRSCVPGGPPARGQHVPARPSHPAAARARPAQLTRTPAAARPSSTCQTTRASARPASPSTGSRPACLTSC